MNWYTYCGGNPIRFFDPWGLALTEWDKLFLSSSDQKKISAHTADWEYGYKLSKSKNEQERKLGLKYMNDAHSLCEDIRDRTRNQYGGAFSGSKDGNTIANVSKLQTYIKSSDGGTFISPDSAAWAFGWAYNDKSINDKTEYGANIYRNDESFYIQQIKTGSNEKVYISAADSQYGVRVATIHTHAYYRYYKDNDNFSSNDINNANGRGPNGTNSYLVSSGGYLQMYNPTTDTVTVISYSMPSDPKHPNPNNPKFHK